MVYVSNFMVHFVLEVVEVLEVHFPAHQRSRTAPRPQGPNEALNWAPYTDPVIFSGNMYIYMYTIHLYNIYIYIFIWTIEFEPCTVSCYNPSVSHMDHRAF